MNIFQHAIKLLPVQLNKPALNESVKTFDSLKILLLSFEWNSIRLGSPAHGIVIKTVHKTLPGGGGW